jgi:hypothetical protein
MSKGTRKPSEIIGELSKSKLQKHTYVFVEGIDDVKIYKEIGIRKKYDLTKFTFEQVEGRVTLFQLNEDILVKGLTGKTLLFADQDTFVFNSIPSKYENIKFTRGYSIENDLFEDGYDSLMNELSLPEKNRFDLLINSVSEWYAYEIEKILAGNSSDSFIKVKGSNPKFIAPKSEQVEPAFLMERGYTRADEMLCQQIKNDYKLLFRGKMLFELLLLIHLGREPDRYRNHKIESFWNSSFHRGLETVGSNCNRIASIFENQINNF